MVLKEPLEEFFGREEKLAWLRAQVQTAGGDPTTVDEVLQGLLAEKAQREADAQSLVLPSLQMGGAEMALRTTREGEEVLGSIMDYLRWLGVEDDKGNTWSHWLREEFRHSSDLRNDEITASVTYVEKQLQWSEPRAEPVDVLSRLRWVGAQAMYDEALLGLRLRDRSFPRCSLRSFLSATADDTIMAASTLPSSEANHDGVTTERSDASSLEEASSVALYACVKAVLSLGNWLSVSLLMLSMGPLAGLLRYTLSKSTRKICGGWIGPSVPTINSTSLSTRPAR